MNLDHVRFALVTTDFVRTQQNDRERPIADAKNIGDPGLLSQGKLALGS
jgi:hypothetical protein